MTGQDLELLDMFACSAMRSTIINQYLAADGEYTPNYQRAAAMAYAMANAMIAERAKWKEFLEPKYKEVINEI